MTTMSKESENPCVSAEWKSLNTSLAITRDKLDASAIDQALGLSRLPGVQSGASVHSGPGWWAFTFDARCSPDLDDQVSALVSQITPHLDQLKDLIDAGHFIQVAIAGTVEVGDQLVLSPQSAGRLATLGLPVSFTTLTQENRPSDDPLSWLD